MPKKTHRPQWLDLRKILKNTTLVITDHDLIYPRPCEGEVGCNYPHSLLHFNPPDYYGVVIIYLDRQTSEDFLMITTLHEAIHIWLYLKGIFDHDEEWIDQEAERVYNLNKNLVKKYVYKLIPTLKEIVNKSQ